MPVHEIHMCMRWSLHVYVYVMIAIDYQNTDVFMLRLLHVCTSNICVYTKIMHVIRTQTCLCSQLDRARWNKAWTRGLTLRVQCFPILNLHSTANNLMLSRCKMLNKALVSWIQQHIKKKNMSYPKDAEMGQHLEINKQNLPDTQ